MHMKHSAWKIIGSWFACLLATTLFTGCPMGENSTKGFRLPEGSIADGKAAFTDLGCFQCHSVVNVDLASSSGKSREIHVVLGGEVTRVKTYAQLVTSIINPSHVISRQNREKYTDANGKSMMPDFSEKMTVRQMIDIAEFLQAHYEVVIPDYPYNEYGYGP